jgi:hypothetical protein
MNPTSRNGLMLLVLVLIGINMRPLLTSIGPLLPLFTVSLLPRSRSSRWDCWRWQVRGLSAISAKVADCTEPDDDRLRRCAS